MVRDNYFEVLCSKEKSTLFSAILVVLLELEGGPSSAFVSVLFSFKLSLNAFLVFFAQLELT